MKDREKDIVAGRDDQGPRGEDRRPCGGDGSRPVEEVSAPRPLLCYGFDLLYFSPSFPKSPTAVRVVFAKESVRGNFWLFKMSSGGEAVVVGEDSWGGF